MVVLLCEYSKSSENFNALLVRDIIYDAKLLNISETATINRKIFSLDSMIRPHVKLERESSLAYQLD